MGRVTTVNAICIITSCAIIMPVERNRSRLVWSVLSYHPRTYTHSASAVMQQPVCILYRVIRAVSRTSVGWHIAKYDSRPKYQNLCNKFALVFLSAFFSCKPAAQFILADTHDARNAGIAIKIQSATLVIVYICTICTSPCKRNAYVC